MFDPQFCVIDLFGHSKIAGKVSEQAIGGQSFIRVDVPAIEGQPAFTKFYGQGAIYSITPVDESTCLLAAKSYQVAPIDIYRLVIPERYKLLEPEDFEDENEPDGNGDIDF